MLCRLHRAGELTAVRTPSPAEEIVRDLVRAREDQTEDILRARHRTTKLLLRHGRAYREGKGWTAKHLRWIREQQFESALLASLLDHHLAVIETRLAQRSALDAEIAAVAHSEPYAEPVRRLSCLRGIKELRALTLLVEGR